MDKEVAPAHRKPVPGNGPSRSVELCGPRRADPIVARNQHGSTQRSNIFAQTNVRRVGCCRQLGSEPYICLIASAEWRFPSVVVPVLVATPLPNGVPGTFPDLVPLHACQVGQDSSGSSQPPPNQSVSLDMQVCWPARPRWNAPILSMMESLLAGSMGWVTNRQVSCRSAGTFRGSGSRGRTKDARVQAMPE